MSHPNGSDGWWTDARVAELKTRWANWETFSEIASALGHWSRNAIIGKAHRLGLKRDGETKHQPRPRLRRRNSNRHSYQGETMTSEDTTPPPSFLNPKRFITLDASDCHWPGAGIVGPDLICCAAPVVHGYPYCLAHCRIAYQALPWKRP